MFICHVLTHKKMSSVTNWLYIIRHRKHNEYDHVTTEILNPSDQELLCKIETILKYDMIAQFGKVGLHDGELIEASPYSKLTWMYDRCTLETKNYSIDEYIARLSGTVSDISKKDVDAITIILEKNGRSWDYQIKYELEDKSQDFIIINNPSFVEMKKEIMRIRENHTITTIRKRGTNDYVESSRYSVNLPRDEDYIYIYESHGWWHNLKDYASRLESMGKIKYFTNVDIYTFNYMIDQNDT